MNISCKLSEKTINFFAFEDGRLRKKLANTSHLYTRWHTIRECILAVEEAIDILEEFGVVDGLCVMRDELEASRQTYRALHQKYGSSEATIQELNYANELKTIIETVERFELQD